MMLASLQPRVELRELRFSLQILNNGHLQIQTACSGRQQSFLPLAKQVHSALYSVVSALFKMHCVDVQLARKIPAG